MVPDGDVETDEEDSGRAAAGGLVAFGQHVRINPTVRLFRFDNGNSKAYEGYDERDNNKKFIALVAGVDSLPRSSFTAAYNNLADTSFMRLVGSGVVFWPTEGQQKYVFLYAGGVGDRLVPKEGFIALQWRHPDIVEYLVQPIARILREMADKSFFHGSIRPDNIFHSAPDKKGAVILGDCLSVQPSSTQESLYLPVDKAQAEPLGRGSGSISDDIYAFGVTMAMALRKTDDLSDLEDEEIVRRKMETGSYATIIGKERFQASFLELLRGMLHDDPALRWGLDEIFSWLDGSRMTPSPLSKRKKATRPLPFNEGKYLYVDVLALDIHKNPTEMRALVEDGRLMQWLDKSLNHTEVTERYCKFIERLASSGGSSANSELFITSLRMVFNPVLPIMYKGRIFTHDGFGAMLARAAYDGGNLAFYKEVLNANVLDMATGYKVMHQNDIIAALRLFDVCRSSLRLDHKIEYGVERCLYMLCKNVPCLSPKFNNYFVHDHKSALLTYEKICAKGGEVALFMDKHAITFFSVVNPNGMDHAIYDLTAAEKDRKILGNLKFFSVMQRNSEGIPCPEIAKVFSDSISGIVRVFKNKELQKKITANVQKAAQEGNLVAMAAFFEDDKLMARDQLAFKRSLLEYRALQKEYDEYNKRLANKKTYGIVNGRDAAAVVSWSFSTVITLIVVFSYMSGFKMF